MHTATSIPALALRAFHGDPAISADQAAAQAITDGLVSVNAETGDAFSKRNSNKRLGCLNQAGYLVCTLHISGQRKQVKLHRLVWIAVYGSIPTNTVIDHINRNKSDNRISNLRLADAKLNALNRRRYLGEANPACRIDAATARRIRSNHPSKSYASIAKEFCVSKSLVAQIVRKELWS